MQHITPLRYKSRSGERHSSNSPAAHNILHSYHEPMQSIYTTGQNLPRYSLPIYPISPDKLGYGSQGGVKPTIASHDAMRDSTMRDSLQRIKDEQRVALQSEMKLAMMELKNNLFEQQFGFERQICNLINRFTNDLKPTQDPSQVKTYIDEEAQKIHKLVLDDIGAQQKWTDTIIDGVETLKRSQEDKALQIEEALKELAGDIAAVRNHTVEHLAPVSIQLKELEQRIDAIPVYSPPTEQLERLNQHNANIRQQLQKVQENLDALHRLTVEKTNKESTDSNFKVMQDEVDNLKVKVAFNQQKTQKAHDGLKVRVEEVENGYQGLGDKVRAQYQQDNLVMQSQLQGLTDYVQDLFKQYQQEIDVLKQRPNEQQDLSSFVDESRVNDLRSSLEDKLEQMQRDLDQQRQLGHDVKSYAQKIEERVKREFMAAIEQVDQAHGKDLQELKEQTAQELGQLQKGQLAYQDVFTKRHQEQGAVIDELKHSSGDHEEILNSLQSSHSAMREELDQLRDKLMQLDSNFTNCDISMKDIAKTDQQQLRELSDSLKRAERDLQNDLLREKSGLETFIMQTHSNLEAQVKGLRHELSEVLEQLSTQQGESLLKLKQLFDSSQSRSSALEGKLLSMNEGVNDLIDQFEVSQGVLETLDTRLTHSELEIKKLKVQENHFDPSQLLDQMTQQERKLREELLRLETRARETYAGKQELEELRYTVDQLEMNLRDLEQASGARLEDIKTSLDDQHTAHTLQLQEVKEALTSLGQKVDTKLTPEQLSKETTKLQADFELEVQVMRENIKAKHELSSKQLEQLALQTNTQLSENAKAFREEFEDLKRDTQWKLQLIEGKLSVKIERSDLEHAQDSIRQALDQLSLALNERIQNLEESLAHQSRETSSLAELKPELDELEERIHEKHITLSDKLSGLSQNVYDLLATNKENMPHLQNIVTQQELERRVNILQGELGTRVSLQEFERRLGHVNTDVKDLKRQLAENAESQQHALAEAVSMLSAKYGQFEECLKLLQKSTLEWKENLLNEMQNLVSKHALEDKISYIEDKIDLLGSSVPLQLQLLEKQAQEMVNATENRVQHSIQEVRLDISSHHSSHHVSKQEVDALIQKQDGLEEKLSQLNRSEQELNESLLLYRETNSKLEGDLLELQSRQLLSPEALLTSSEDLKKLISDLSGRQNATQQDLQVLKEALEQHSQDDHGRVNERFEGVEKSVLEIEHSTNEEIDSLKNSLRLSIGNLTDILQTLSDSSTEMKGKVSDLEASHHREVDSLKGALSREIESLKQAIETKASSQVQSEQSILIQGCQLEVDSLKMSIEQLHAKHSQSVLHHRQESVQLGEGVKAVDIQAKLLDEEVQKLRAQLSAAQKELQEQQRATIKQASDELIATVDSVQSELDGKIQQVRALLEEVRVVKQRTDAKLSEYGQEIEALKEKTESQAQRASEAQSLSEAKYSGEIRQLREKFNSLKVQPDAPVNDERIPHILTSLGELQAKIQELEEGHSKLTNQDIPSMAEQLQQEQAFIERLEEELPNMLNDLDILKERLDGKVKADEIKQSLVGEQIQALRDVLKVEREEVKKGELAMREELQLANENAKREKARVDQAIENLKKLNEEQYQGVTQSIVKQNQLLHTLNEALQALTERVEALEGQEQPLTQEQIIDILQANLDNYLLKEDFASSLEQVLLRLDGLETHSHPQIEMELAEVRQQLDGLEEGLKQGQLETKLRIDTVADDMRTFGLNVINDMEFMEQKLIEAIQKDTIALIEKDELDPIKNRLKHLESGSASISPQRNIIIDDSETPSTNMKQWRQEHSKLVDEIRRRRIYFLRKTPMDQRIEDLMGMHNITQQEAYRVYQDELDRKRSSFMNAMNNSSVSPLRNVSNRPDSRSIERQSDARNASFFQSIYKNLVERVTPSRQEGNQGLESVADRYSTNQPKRQGTLEEANLDIDDLDEERDDVVPQYAQDTMKRMSIGISPNRPRGNEVGPFQIGAYHEDNRQGIKPYMRGNENVIPFQQEYSGEQPVAFSSSRRRDQLPQKNIFDVGSLLEGGDDFLRQSAERRASAAAEISSAGGQRKIIKGLNTPQFDESSMGGRNNQPQQNRFDSN